MNNYPSECIALSKGKKEVRLFVERGTYVKYTYICPDTGNIIKAGKETIIIKDDGGKFEKIFLIPTNDKSFTSLCLEISKQVLKLQ
ncbi:MAG: hypothetical protein CVT89_02830 [Candidatus Altiarchaeales archaeon HGW-Altiarchaeales-2]|nr:MAG: hypothetical protein CVT89_02830 [Candidatus Altiarchaeales archaeon HGW-Altiarchaeales-2]